MTLGVHVVRILWVSFVDVLNHIVMLDGIHKRRCGAGLLACNRRETGVA